jgi:hypothetical protein
MFTSQEKYIGLPFTGNVCRTGYGKQKQVTGLRHEKLADAGTSDNYDVGPGILAATYARGFL